MTGHCDDRNSKNPDAPEIKEAWKISVTEPMDVIKTRFERLSLKEEPIKVENAVTEQDIDIFSRHMRELFPPLR